MRLLSKSKLIAFRQCPKRLWLEVHRPELRDDSTATEASFQVGHQVGAAARKIYDPEGRGNVIDPQTEGYDAAFSRSARLLAESHEPLFEAGFKADGALAFADVMLPVGPKSRRSWRMVEVKSSTSVKDYHRDDVAMQTYIARAAGVPLHSVALACIDSSWVYPGDGDYRGLLKETDLTEEAIGRADEVKRWLAEAQRVVDEPSEPEVSVGDHCTVPFACGFCNYCNQGITQPRYPLDWLPHLSATKRAQIASMGIDDLCQAPDDLLNDRQQLVKRHTLAQTVYFDAAGAAADLSGFKLPAYFLDFETTMFAVPIWAGTRPYQHIPFQFSVHMVSAEGQLSHVDFLDLTGDDPSQLFSNALTSACGPSGPVFVYNAAFESARINELAQRYPTFAKALQDLSARLVDLLPIARARYYHPSQHGSWSIKAVLPAAVPELSYDALEGVKDGTMAMEAYAEALLPETSAARRCEIERQLRAYCRLDTFALVRLWQFFKGQKCEILKDE